MTYYNKNKLINWSLFLQAIFIIIYLVNFDIISYSKFDNFFKVGAFIFMPLSVYYLKLFSDDSFFAKHLFFIHHFCSFYILFLLSKYENLLIMMPFTWVVLSYLVIVALGLVVRKKYKLIVSIGLSATIFTCLIIVLSTILDIKLGLQIYNYLLKIMMLMPIFITGLIWRKTGIGNRYGRKRLLFFSVLNAILFGLSKVPYYIDSHLLYYYDVPIYILICILYIFSLVSSAFGKKEIKNIPRLKISQYLKTLYNKKVLVLFVVILIFISAMGALKGIVVFILINLMVIQHYLLTDIKEFQNHILSEPELLKLVKLESLARNKSDENAIIKYLHNEVQQDLMYIHRQIRKNPNCASTEIEEILDHTITEIRMLTSRDRYSLEERIKQILVHMSRYWDENLLIDYFGENVDSIPSPYDEVVYSSVREIINNIYKYSDGEYAEVNIKIEEEKVKLNSYNTVDKSKLITEYFRGSGLINIKETIEQLGGTVEVEVSEGFKITIELPIQGEISFEDFINRRS